MELCNVGVRFVVFKIHHCMHELMSLAHIGILCLLKKIFATAMMALCGLIQSSGSKSCMCVSGSSVWAQ